MPTFDPAKLLALTEDPAHQAILDDAYSIYLDAKIATTIGGNFESKAAAFLRTETHARLATALAAELLVAVEVGAEVLGEDLVNAGRGGGLHVESEKASVLAGTTLHLQLKIDDLAPPEALMPGAGEEYAHSIATAEASAEQRLINRLDALGLGHLAPRSVDYGALAGYIEGHEQGPATAIHSLQGALIVRSVPTTEILR